MEVKNRLLNYYNAWIYQNDEWFKFSLDSVLLANFVTINLSAKKIIDFAMGNAPIPMLLTYRTSAKIYGIELQKEIFELGKKSIIENRMNNQVEIINNDIKNVQNVFGCEEFDVVLCNPPYFKTDKQELLNNNEIKTLARHEITLTLEDIFISAGKILKNKGIFAMVHRPERFMEIINLMKKYNIEPKRIRFVYPKDGKEANILLIEGIKNGNPGLKILSPLFVYNKNGEYNKEIKDMFGDDTHVAK